MIKNWYPLPFIPKTLFRLFVAYFYTKSDVHNTYNMITIDVGDMWKKTFKTLHGLFGSLVMLFGLPNTPIYFQEFINDAL
jgi:hypothetical protein